MLIECSEDKQRRKKKGLKFAIQNVNIVSKLEIY